MGRHRDAGSSSASTALNCFIDDVYHEQRIIKDGVVPREIIDNSKNSGRECIGIDAAARASGAHICGTDLVRDERRRDVRPRRQPARAVRRVLHDREPARS